MYGNKLTSLSEQASDMPISLRIVYGDFWKKTIGGGKRNRRDQNMRSYGTLFVVSCWVCSNLYLYIYQMDPAAASASATDSNRSRIWRLLMHAIDTYTGSLWRESGLIETAGNQTRMKDVHDSNRPTIYGHICTGSRRFLPRVLKFGHFLPSFLLSWRFVWSISGQQGAKVYLTPLQRYWSPEIGQYTLTTHHTTTFPAPSSKMSRVLPLRLMSAVIGWSCTEGAFFVASSGERRTTKIVAPSYVLNT